VKTTDCLAIYGAVLSTIVFVWHLIQSRPRLKVDVIFGIDGKGNAIRHGIYIFVRNVSSHNVHLSSVEILYPYMAPTLKRRLEHVWRFKAIPRRVGWVHSSLSNYSVDSGCPISLEARQSHSVFIPQATLEMILSKASERAVMACVQDQLWNNVYSGKFKCPAQTVSLGAK
jgi:hypothetical protein